MPIQAGKTAEALRECDQYQPTEMEGKSLKYKNPSGEYRMENPAGSGKLTEKL